MKNLSTLLSPLFFIPVFLVAGCGGGGGGTGTGESVSAISAVSAESSSYSFADDGVDFGITDIVSPEAVLLDDGSVRLYTTGGGGISVYQSPTGLAFTTSSRSIAFTQEVANTPAGSDPTLIRQADGSWRMYYVDQLDKTVKTATSPDGLTFTNEAVTGIVNSTGVLAWGVPDTIVTPEGSVRIFWVDMASNFSREVIRSAVAIDGVTFVEESGYRTTGGFVDPFIVKAETGDWMGLFPTGPGEALQRIYVGTSSDGLTWSLESSPLISLDGANALDPTAVKVGENQWRVYYVATTGPNSFSGFFLKSGLLTKK